MVQPCRVDPHGHCPVLVSDSRLRGPPGFGVGPVLEARRIFPALGSEGFVSGHFIHGIVPCESSAAPCPATGPLLCPVLCQICHRASDCHGARPRAGTPCHAQKEEGLEINSYTLQVFVTAPRTPLVSFWVSLNSLGVCLMYFWVPLFGKVCTPSWFFFHLTIHLKWAFCSVNDSMFFLFWWAHVCC